MLTKQTCFIGRVKVSAELTIFYIIKRYGFTIQNIFVFHHWNRLNDNWACQESSRGK